jgi:hypothetical protein
MITLHNLRTFNFATALNDPFSFFDVLHCMVDTQLPRLTVVHDHQGPWVPGISDDQMSALKEHAAACGACCFEVTG